MPFSKPYIDSTAKLQALLKERIVFLDGAMGTMIQKHKLTEKHFRGLRFANHPSDLKGASDLLVLTQPSVITDIHREYFQAGCDMVETNTFGANAIVLAEYGMAELSREMNLEGARLAREAADLESKIQGRPLFVAGSVGPLTKAPCCSPPSSHSAPST